MSHLGERGPTTLVLVQGKAGLGRSRFVMELARRRAEGGDLTLWAQCREELSRSPYAPFAEIMRQLYDRHHGVYQSLLEHLSEEQRMVLARRFAPFGGEGVTLAGVQDAQWRSQFFAALVEVLRVLGREHRLALAFDDLDVADVATLKVLTYLLRHDRQDATGAGLPVFASVSRSAIVRGPASGAFHAFWRFVSVWPTVGVVELSALTPQDCLAFINTCFPGNDFPPSLAARCHRLSGGNPMHLQEALIVLALSGVIFREGPLWRLDDSGVNSLPEDLQSLLRQRLAFIDIETTVALEGASIMGSRFSVALLQQILGTNEGHARELADRALDHKLLTDVTSATGEALSFASRRIRDLTYEGVDEETRREVHGKIAALKENFEVVDMDDALAEASWHADREGHAGRADNARLLQAQSAETMWRPDEVELYLENASTGVAPAIEVDIPEFATPLDGQALREIPGLLKALLTLQRGVQMYPPGSQFIDSATRECLGILQSIFAHVDGVTLKERGGRIEVNGDGLELDLLGQVGTDMVDLARRSHIHSVTFTRAVSVVDLITFAEGATGFGAAGYALREGDWGELLAERHVQGLGVVPKKYRATSGGEEVAEDERLEGLASEAERHLPLLKDILRFTAGTAEATLLYPEGSETVKRAVSGLARSLEQAHSHLSSVNLGVTAEGFLVNDMRLDARTFGAAVESMRQLLNKVGVNSLSFHAGVSASEIEVLFRYLVSELAEPQDPASWSHRLNALEVGHIGVDEYVFVAADARSVTEEAVVEANEVLGYLSDDGLLSLILDSPLEDVVSSPILPEVGPLLTRLLADGEQEKGRMVVDRFCVGLSADDPTLRGGAMAVIRALVTDTSSLVMDATVAAVTLSLTQRLREERVVPLLTELIRLATDCAEHLLQRDEVRAASRIMWLLGRGFPAEPELDAQCLQASQEAVHRLMASKHFESTLRDLWTKDDDRRALALHLLEGCGDHAVDRLLRFAFETESEERFLIHADQVRAVGSPKALEQRLSEYITPFEASSVVIRSLELATAVRALSDDMIIRGFQHPSNSVLDVVSTIMTKLPRQRTARLFGRLSRFNESRVRLRFVQLLGQLTPPTAFSLLSNVLGQPGSSIELRVACCLSLGKLKDDASVARLADLLVTSWWQRLLGIAQTDDVRAAAAWALGSTRLDVAREVLVSYRHDHCAEVRKAVESAVPSSGDD